MEYKRQGNTVIVRVDKGEDIIKELLGLSEKENILFASVSGLGAVNDIELGIFDTSEKRYHSKRFTGDFEITSLVGTLSRKDKKPYIHVHMSVGNVITNEFVGGHLNKAIVGATAEIVLNVVDVVVEREFVEEIGLNLFKF
ncbi:MAG: DNA-binding protein [Lachnospiraceae bacterium oral taxon 082]|jgi:predicted DNA-binding protein with PD1-like DNA-binding motif|nr:DNA-binding protein [Lachnospiraceae bacterium oral taxon 082]